MPTVRSAIRTTLVLFLGVVVAACAAGPGPAGAVQPSGSNAWPAAYDAAVADAINPEPDEVVRDLVAIRPDNPDLQWQAFDGEPHVLMASVVADTLRYAGRVGTAYNPGTHSIWVTAVPELGRRCGATDFAGARLVPRLRQLLGLTPNATVVAVVEFWVRPDDLFRPAADREVTDTTAGLSLPDDVPAWYRAWFNDLRAKQYVQSVDPRHNAYPWTQLGYTYDWGAEGSEQGLSEFVIRTDVRVVVESITPVSSYCAGGAR